MRNKWFGLVAVCGLALGVYAQDTAPALSPGSHELSLTLTGRVNKREYAGKPLYTFINKDNPKDKYNLINLKVIPIPEGETIDNYVDQEVTMTFVYIRQIGEDGKVKGGYTKSVQSFKKAVATPQP